MVVKPRLILAPVPVWQDNCGAENRRVPYRQPETVAKEGAMDVAEVMAREVYTCTVQDSLNTAARIMWEHDCGCVPVLDGVGRVVGMLTDRDICMAAYTRGERLPALAVATAMSKAVHACAPDDSLATAEELMRVNRVRRLPVVDTAGQLIGVLSLNDIARIAARERNRKTKRRVKADEVVDTLAAVSEPHPADQINAR
jgi:CBS domain-containing protein